MQDDIIVVSKADIVAAACLTAGISLATVQKKVRDVEVSRRRWHVMAILRARGWSMDMIGTWVNRDHTTVVHGLKKWAALPEADRPAVAAPEGGI